ncbi:ribonuclease YeeF family protein [Bacillus nakamurai]|uniref:ribonuclease YeeF family protein n=1 Tax=Bacillus nakamurai TaxID=1793963 RepID=UPI001E4D9C0B|nr:LXG domain-containing protein [Bacillus nakamurai]MCC9021928.1 LXG domain-containing protein [Bacillus nakamurai]
MKTLDVCALREGIQHTIESLDKQKDQLAKLSQSIKQLAAMKDALRGKGGDAIRAFYEECHMPFLQFYEMVIDEYKSVLQKTNSRLFALEPDANGMIVQGFLEHEAKQGLRQAKQAAEQLVIDINRQAASVSHIMSLPTVHDGIFREETHRAEKKIDDTLEQLYEFDSTQNQALKETKADVQTMKRYMEQLQSMYTGPKIGITTYNSGSILKSTEEEKLNDTFSMLKTQLASSEQSPMTVMLEKLNKHHHETAGALKKNMQNDQIEQDIAAGGSTLTVLQKEAAAHPRIDGDIRVIHDKLYNHKGLKAIDTIEVIDETSGDTASIDYIGGKYHVYENGQIVREFRTGGKKKLEIVSRIPQNKIGGAKELDTYFTGTPYEVLEWIYPAGLVRNLAKHTVKRLAEKGVTGEAKKILKKTDGISKFGENGWDLGKNGGVVNNRRYSQHALERMAPNRPEVRAELFSRATKKAKEIGLRPQTIEYKNFINKYIDPRNIPPSVIEDAIKNNKAIPGNKPGTFVHSTKDVQVVLNASGDVITVIPK